MGIGFTFPIGTWTIKVQLNKNPHLTTKSFEVEKNPDNRVKVFIEVLSKVSIYHRHVKLNVFAKQHTNVYASGMAKVSAKVVSMRNNNVIAIKEKPLKLTGRDNNVKFHFANDLGIRYLSSDARIIFSINFIDDLTASNFEMTRETILSVAGKYMLSYNLKSFHAGRFNELIVKVHTLAGQLITDRAMKVELSATYSHDVTKHLRHEILENGTVKFILHPRLDTELIDIELKTDDSKESFNLHASNDEEFFEINLPDNA